MCVCVFLFSLCVCSAYPCLNELLYKVIASYLSAIDEELRPNSNIPPAAIILVKYMLTTYNKM